MSNYHCLSNIKGFFPLQRKSLRNIAYVTFQTSNSWHRFSDVKSTKVNLPFDVQLMQKIQIDVEFHPKCSSDDCDPMNHCNKHV